MTKYVGIALALTGIAFGVWQSYWFVYPYCCYRETVGSVLRIETEKISTAGGETGSREVTFRPKITHQYSVDDVTYTGSAFNNSGRGLTDQAAKDFVGRFEVGGRISVFYDPGYPQRSFVERDFDWYAFLIFPAILVGSCILLIYLLPGFRRSPVKVVQS